MLRHVTLRRRQAIKVVAASGIGLATLQPELAAAQQKVAKSDAR
jgi:hypothetical protein